MITTIENPWITLPIKREGIDVQRAYAGMYPQISMPDDNGKSVIESCLVYYHERELYPSGKVIKYDKKFYSLEDLAQTDVGDDMQKLEKLILSVFIRALGYPSLINPVRVTLADLAVLPLEVENGYPLHRDTRNLIKKTNENLPNT